MLLFFPRVGILILDV